jgi:tellurite resistance protein
MTQPDMSAAKDLPDDKLDALVEMMFLAAYADEEFSDDERAHFKKSVQSLTDGRLDAERLAELLTQCEKDLAASDRATRLEAVKARLPDPGARKVALDLAIQVMAADGIIRTSERELIMETADALDLDRDMAADMVQRLEPKG